jgi:hypothetical protein
MGMGNEFYRKGQHTRGKFSENLPACPELGFATRLPFTLENPMKSFVVLCALAFVGALTVIACGNDKPASDPTSTSTAEATATATAAPSAAPAK